MAKPNQARIKGYLGRLFGYAFSLSGDREQARDLVQDCALKALAAVRIPADDAAYRAWLFRILRNTFIDRQRRPVELNTLMDGEEPGANGSEIWHFDDRMISVLTVRLGMARLSPDHREVIAAIDIIGFSYAEAAEFFSVPVGTVMSRLSRARQALLHEIGESKVQALPLRSKQA